MNKNDRKHTIAHEIFIIMLSLALLLFVCRLWPLLLVLILGIIVAMIRMLFLSVKKDAVIEPKPIEPIKVTTPTEKDVKNLAYSVILRRITELVEKDYPNARWIWETSNARQMIERGDEVYILLNRAGGYRKAKVVISNLQVLSIEYINGTGAVVTPTESEDKTEEPVGENYELLAFEWVEAHIMDLNERSNDAIGEGITEIVIQSDELPIAESWPDICKELMRAGIRQAKTVPEGIKINLMFEKQKGNVR